MQKKFKITFFWIFYILPFLLFSFDEKRFDEILIKGPPKWAQEKLNLDFFDIKQDKKEGVRFGDAFDTYTIICKIKSNRLSFYNQYLQKYTPSKDAYGRVKSLFFALKFLCKKNLLKDCFFVVNYGDSITKCAPLPILCFAKNKMAKHGICIPDFEALYGYNNLREEIKKGISLYPFEKKIDKAFWRGSTTGGQFRVANWMNYPRSQLVLVSKSQPDLVDAKFTAIVQTSEEDLKNLEKIFREQDHLSKPTSVIDHFAYKYLIDIDGNSCTYSRLFWILSSNSVCLKQESDEEQWYYTGIKPNVHYLSFKKDSSDLLEKISDAKNNEIKVRKIIDAANEFANENLCQEMCFAYLYWAITRYAEALEGIDLNDLL